MGLYHETRMLPCRGQLSWAFCPDSGYNHMLSLSEERRDLGVFLICRIFPTKLLVPPALI